MITFRYGCDFCRMKMLSATAKLSQKIIKYDFPENWHDQRHQRLLVDIIVEDNEAGKSSDIISSSDVILDSLRLAVAEGKLSPDDLNILFYSISKDDPKTVEVNKIKVYPSGDLEIYPNGFMDEHSSILLDLVAAQTKLVEKK